MSYQKGGEWTLNSLVTCIKKNYTQTIWTFNMLKIDMSGIVIPPQLEGRWKFFQDLYIEGDTSDCYMKRGEVVNQ